jgi:hypothetical protein
LELCRRTLALAARPDNPQWPIALGRTAFPLPADLVNLAEIVEPDLYDDDDEFAIEGGGRTDPSSWLVDRRADHDPLRPRRARYRRSGALVAGLLPKPSRSAWPGRSPIRCRPTRAARTAPKQLRKGAPQGEQGQRAHQAVPAKPGRPIGRELGTAAAPMG